MGTGCHDSVFFALTPKFAAILEPLSGGKIVRQN
jgi:hypothetical protein